MYDEKRAQECASFSRTRKETKMIADIVSNAQEAAHTAVSNGWDILEQASLFVRKLPYLIPDALNEFNRNITGF
nr:MAG TPA: hypothetical protein [Caudoviricetes sp.]